MLTYIKTAISNPKEIYIGRNMKNKHFFSIAFIIILLLSLLTLFEFIPAFQSVQADFSEIRESIPDYEIVEDELVSTDNSYIHQTNSMIFYFDPDDNVTTEVIDKNTRAITVPLSVGLLNDRIHVNIIGQPYSFVYSEMNNFSTSDLQSIILSLGTLSSESYFILFFVLFIVVTISYAYQIIILSLIASISNMLTNTRLRFFQVIKMVMLAHLIPALLVNLVSAFFTFIPFDFEIISIITLVIFFISLNEMSVRMKKDMT